MIGVKDEMVEIKESEIVNKYMMKFTLKKKLFKKLDVIKRKTRYEFT
jgi:hypothetical protein